MLKEAQRYLAFVKAAEAGPCLDTLEKHAMWNGFYDELQKIAEQEAAVAMAHTYARKKIAGVIAETLGGITGAVMTEKAINKFHPGIGHGAHVAALTAGALGGSILASKMTARKEPRPGTPGSPEYTAGKEDHSGMGLVAASWYLQRQQSGLAKAAGIAPYIAQPLMHAAAGGAIGAGVGAWRAKPGERAKGALKGGAIGAAGGAAAGHVYKRVARGVEAGRQAAVAHGFPNAREAMKAPNAKTIAEHANALKSQMPIYPGKTVTSAAKQKKDDPYNRVGDSTWDKHKGKIIAGLALATAAGVGGKLLYNRHKFGKTHAAPAHAPAHAPAPAAAPRAAAPKAAPRPKPKKPGHVPFSRGRTWRSGAEVPRGGYETYDDLYGEG